MTTVVMAETGARRARYDEEFGREISRLLDERSLSLGQAAVATGGKVSASYFHHMRRGKVPSYDVLEVLRDTFGADKVGPLFLTAGYEPPSPMGAFPLEVQKIADQRGIPVEDVLPTLVKEALEEYG
jgi:hypothetical protein